LKKIPIILLLVLATFFITDSTLTPTVYAEEFAVNIPFGAFNRVFFVD